MPTDETLKAVAARAAVIARLRGDLTTAITAIRREIVAADRDGHGRNQIVRAALGGLSRKLVFEALKATYTLSIIEGDAGRDAAGQDLSEMPFSYADLPDATVTWLEANGYDPEHPDRWVLVTPAGEDPCAVNVIATRTVTI